jgi:hypothetical protein
MSKQGKQAPATNKRRAYRKPEIRTEKILDAGLGHVCNGTAGGGRKAVAPCTTLKT